MIPPPLCGMRGVVAGLLLARAGGVRGPLADVDGVVGEVVVEGGIDDGYVGALGEKVGVLATNALAEVEAGTLGEGIALR